MKIILIYEMNGQNNQKNIMKMNVKKNENHLKMMEMDIQLRHYIKWFKKIKNKIIH